jgi:hypothetical protein
LTPVNVDVLEEPSTSNFRINGFVSDMMNWKEKMGKCYRTGFAYRGKGKSIQSQTCTCPEDSKRMRLPDFKTICT